MQKSELFTIAQAATKIAMHGASEYLRVKQLKADDHALSECIGSWVKLTFPEAMRDAKDAIDCGMTQASIATFNASMINAGIQAAKECAMPA